MMAEEDFYCAYRASGGMQGMDYDLCLKQEGAGNPLLIYSVREWHNSPERSGSLTVPEGTVEQLKTLFREHNMGSWPVLSKLEMRILDAPRESVSIRVDGMQCSFMYDDIMPDGCWTLLGDIRDILMGCIPR